MRGGRSDGGDVESWLVMPAMTLKSGIATLEFMSKGETPTVSLVQSNNSVWISVAGDDKSLGAGFTLLEDLTAIQTADWQKITIDLAAYAGQMVYIAFKYEGSDFTGDVWGSTAWVIDDIEVNSELAIYTVTINEPTHGSILVKDAEDNVLAIGDHQIVDGTVLTLTATPDTDCVFEAWWDGETENPRTVFVEGDMIIDATFIQIPRFKVTIGTSTNGNVFAEYGTAIPIFGEANLLEHTEITMMAVPSTGYRFVEWMDGNKTQNDRKLILTQDTTIFAVFELIPVNSIKDANGKELLNVYPNPVTDVLNIQTEETIKQIVVLDLNGRVVAQFNGNTKTINLQTLPAGNYVVRIHTETAIVPVRIVKQ
jgi:hypothetical protein